MLEICYLYLTKEVEFEQDILQICVALYHLHVYFICFNVVCMSFHESYDFHHIYSLLIGFCNPLSEKNILYLLTGLHLYVRTYGKLKMRWFSTYGDQNLSLSLFFSLHTEYRTMQEHTICSFGLNCSKMKAIGIS